MRHASARATSYAPLYESPSTLQVAKFVPHEHDRPRYRVVLRRCPPADGGLGCRSGKFLHRGNPEHHDSGNTATQIVSTFNLLHMSTDGSNAKIQLNQLTYAFGSGGASGCFFTAPFT